jgi:hypothetical protein
MSDTATRLRAICADIRRKPYALEELIPLMQKAADELEQRKPLTKQKICEDLGFGAIDVEFVRIVEKAHGIGGEHE